MIQIEKHWIFGIGYGAFWLGPGSASQPVLDTLSWIPYQGHNGYLDMLNELGAIGMLLFSGLVLFDMRNLMRLVSVDRKAAALFAAMVVTILVSNLTESSLFRNVGFNFLLLILSSVTVSSMLRARRFNARPPLVASLGMAMTAFSVILAVIQSPRGTRNYRKAGVASR